MELIELIKKAHDYGSLYDCTLDEKYSIDALLEEHKQQSKLLGVGVTLPTNEEIVIEGLEKYPVDLKDFLTDYQNRIQRLNFIDGANWVKKQIEVKR